MLIKLIIITAFLVWFNLLAKAEEIIVPLKDLAFTEPTLRGTEAEYLIKLPIPNRFIVKSMSLHLELEKSPVLVKERSYFSIFLNQKLIYQSVYDPSADIIKIDIPLPINNLEQYNDLKFRSVQHYCTNCCEFESSPELWSRIDVENSYIKIVYDEKPILEDTLLIRDYVLDPKLFNPIRIGIMLQDTSDEYLELSAKLAGYIGSFIRYRKIYISYHTELPEDRDVFIIGTKSYIKDLLNLQNPDFPNIYIVPNPKRLSRAVIFISGNSVEDIEKSLHDFIKIKNELYTGSFYQISQSKDPQFDKFEAPGLIFPGKKIYFYELGYNDITVKGIFPPPIEIEFRLPVGLLIEGKKNVIFHFAHNYGAGAREDSTINIYLNDKYVTSLKIDKKYGVVLKEDDIKIPSYLLSPGRNVLKIEYAMMPPGGGFCISPNIETLRGTVFSRRSYIEIPKLPLWFEMPYLDYFVSEAFPYSIYPDLRETAIYVAEKSPDTISAMLTLSAYIGTKLWAPFFGLMVTSDPSQLKGKDIIAIGKNIPPDFYKNSNIKINSEINLRYPILHTLKEKVGSLISGAKEKERIFAELTYKNALTNQVFYIMAESPYSAKRTITIITSENPKNLVPAVERLFFPKYAGTIKGDITIWDFYVEQYFSENINPKYYIGHLGFFERILYEIGYSPVKFIIGSLIVMLVLALIIKKLLDIREKRRISGET